MSIIIGEHMKMLCFKFYQNRLINEEFDFWGEPNSFGSLEGGVGVWFQNREKYPWAILRRTRRYTKFYPNRTIGKGWKIGGTQNWGEEEDTRSRCQICRFQTVITFFLRETLTLVLKYVLLVYWISRHIWNLSNLE